MLKPPVPGGYAAAFYSIGYWTEGIERGDNAGYWTEGYFLNKYPTDFEGIAGQRSWRAYNEVLNGYWTDIERDIEWTTSKNR